jgi:integrase
LVSDYLPLYHKGWLNSEPFFLRSFVTEGVMKDEGPGRKPIRDRAGVYHYRRRVPDDIRRILRALDEASPSGLKQDKREEKKRLGRDSNLAQQQWEKHHLAVEAKWAQLRKGQVRGLTIVQREALAGDIYRRWIKGWPPEYFHAGLSAGFALMTMEELDGEIPRQLIKKDGRTDDEILEALHGSHVDAVLAARGLVIPEGSRAMLMIAAHRAAKHACRVVMTRAQGDLRDDPDADRYPAWPDPETTTLAGLYKHWVKMNRPAEQTKRDYLSSINKLVASVGFDDVTRLSSKDIQAWCANLRTQRNVGGIRIRDGYLAAVRSILNCAVDADFIKVNPAASVKIRVEKPEEELREKDLQNPEIFAILRATLLPQRQDVSEDVRATRRWVPWLCAYTGARVAEMTRLESRHIIREEGIDGIHIERSKTGRMRKVPLHKHLDDQGFLDFVASRRGRPLFFSKEKLADGRKMTIHKTRAEGLAEWIGTLDGMKDANVAPSHGWRHRFRTECRRIFMDREVRNYLQGHAIENVGEGYGHVPLDVSAPWIEMFPKFDVTGDELVIHRKFDLSLLTQAGARMAELRERLLAEKIAEAAAA